MTRNLAELVEGMYVCDVVNQLYACGSITGWTETEMELTCDTERNTP